MGESKNPTGSVTTAIIIALAIVLIILGSYFISKTFTDDGSQGQSPPMPVVPAYKTVDFNVFSLASLSSVDAGALTSRVSFGGRVFPSLNQPAFDLTKATGQTVGSAQLTSGQGIEYLLFDGSVTAVGKARYTTTDTDVSSDSEGLWLCDGAVVPASQVISNLQIVFDSTAEGDKCPDQGYILEWYTTSVDDSTLKSLQPGAWQWSCDSIPTSPATLTPFAWVGMKLILKAATTGSTLADITITDPKTSTLTVTSKGLTLTD